MNIPHEEIRQRGDRSWSMRLLEALMSTRCEDEVAEICDTLEELDDYRLEAPLLQILHDRNRDGFQRQSASYALRRLTTTETSAERRSCWHSKDAVLQAHSVHMFERTDDDLLWEILSDDTHPLYADAIVHISWSGYEELKFQEILVQALASKDADVRTAAAKGVIYAEPVLAESGLLHALEDFDDDVYNAALTTVSYFGSQKVLLGLRDFLGKCSEERIAETDGVVGGVLNNCFYAMELARAHGPSAEAYFRKWLTPIEDLVQTELARRSELRPDTASEYHKLTSSKKAHKSKSSHPSVRSLLSELDDANGSWRQIRYRSIDWARYKMSERRTLTKFLASHADHSVREIGCTALAAWNETNTLLQLLDDPTFGVRRSAAYRLRDVSPNEDAALKLWQRLTEPGVQSSYGIETLSSYVKHAPSVVLADRLLEYVNLNNGQSNRFAAIRELGLIGAKAHLEGLIPLLKTAPDPSWDLHTAMIGICTDFQFEAPDPSFLSEIDDFDFQSAFAIYRAERSER